MATRKQKHDALMKKREARIAAEREVGLKALEEARERRRRQDLDSWQEQHDKKHNWKKRIKECPHCQIEIAASNTASRASIKESV